jgi:hypothetical protein
MEMTTRLRSSVSSPAWRTVSQPSGRRVLPARRGRQ